MQHACEMLKGEPQMRTLKCKHILSFGTRLRGTIRDPKPNRSCYYLLNFHAHILLLFLFVIIDIIVSFVLFYYNLLSLTIHLNIALNLYNYYSIKAYSCITRRGMEWRGGGCNWSLQISNNCMVKVVKMAPWGPLARWM